MLHCDIIRSYQKYRMRVYKAPSLTSFIQPVDAVSINGHLQDSCVETDRTQAPLSDKVFIGFIVFICFMQSLTKQVQ